MGNTATGVGIALVLVLGAWHLRIRRHPNWRSNSLARFYITLGYPFVAVAVYLLTGASRLDGWDWALGNVWALVAAVCFVKGFQHLDSPQESQPSPMRFVPVTRDAGASRPRQPR
jgi:peptidoglycan/LPS O-acetylase OafA/YrhL